jgi:hypothetical protein
MTAQKNPKLAKRIADKLFVNGYRKKTARLMLVSVSGEDLGGLCKQAVIDRIVEALNE